MPALRVADVSADPAGREAFHAVATAVYADQPAGTAPIQASVERNLGRETQATQRVYVTFDGDRPMARVVARVSAQLRDSDGKPFGMLGFFEAENRQDGADALFREATAWLREQGAGRVIGPMDGDTWHRYRV